MEERVSDGELDSDKNLEMKGSCLRTLRMELNSCNIIDHQL